MTWHTPHASDIHNPNVIRQPDQQRVSPFTPRQFLHFPVMFPATQVFRLIAAQCLSSMLPRLRRTQISLMASRGENRSSRR
jgi:hypothetical protein